ncbi:glycosyltransferase family 2 protein [Tamlana sp. 2201CG12-4]|uniref:glycosyltransferase family 2 protein n=1 Tax=Tamlana sp. 2201CG12-4 TaxID=3112582 RepID=UPI002DBE32FA|nr:glycosyltransferase family 2 protein [Tamlana sp. 2201CG12-4]MEC3907334.1 glycosyltransferase family 2 protein [Tamlana sp. 2201CG12-4]
MVKGPLVSIILPVYNGETYLEQSIESCLGQTYSNIELIIVNDCSTDTSLEIIKRYCAKDTRVKLVNNSVNKKLPASLNIGHGFAKGDYMTWTSHDNFYNPEAIEVMLETIKEKKVDIVYANYNLIEKEQEKNISLKESGFLILSNVIGACFLYHSRVYFRNKYDESLFLVEDYDFWLQGFTQFKFYHIKEVLYNYRNHESSLTESTKRNKKSKDLYAKNIKLAYRKFFVELGLNESYAELFSKMHISPFSIKGKNEILNIKKHVSSCLRKLNLSRAVKKSIGVEVLKLQLKLLRLINSDLTIFDCLKFFVMNASLFDFFHFKVWVKLCLNKK